MSIVHAIEVSMCMHALRSSAKHTVGSLTSLVHLIVLKCMLAACVIFTTIFVTWWPPPAGSPAWHSTCS